MKPLKIGITGVRGIVGELLTAANQILVDDTRTEHFVTLIFAWLNPRTHSIVYANAGHPKGYVLDRAGDVKTRLDSGGPPLGVMPDAIYCSSGEIIVDPGDRLGNRCPNRSATRATCSPLRITWHSPTPCRPCVALRSSE